MMLATLLGALAEVEAAPALELPLAVELGALLAPPAAAAGAPASTLVAVGTRI